MNKWIAAGLLLCATRAWAGPVVTVGVEDIDFYPIARVRGGVYEGYVRDLLDAFARRNGLTLHYLPLPVRRVRRYLAEGRVDMVFPDSPGWDREVKDGKHFVYSRPMAPFHDGVLVRPDHLGKPLTSIAIVYGFTATRLQHAIEQGDVRLEQAPLPADAVRMALRGRVDGVYMALEAARYQMGQLDVVDHLVPDPAALPLKSYHYQLSATRRSADLLARFDRFLVSDAALVRQLQVKYGL